MKTMAPQGILVTPQATVTSTGMYATFQPYCNRCRWNGTITGTMDLARASARAHAVSCGK